MPSVSVRAPLRLALWIAAAADLTALATLLVVPDFALVPVAVAAFVTVAAALVSRGTPASPEPEPESAPASVSDNYELIEHLATGTMGEVWRARHRLLDRDVALKRIKPGDVDEEDTRRFAREARVLSALRSPHTVEVFDFGVKAGGELFYAMELLDGLNLQTAVRDHGPFPPERVVYLLVQACASLKEAHEQGLVHRDIKPANFMICRYGGEFDFLKVLDFGLVKKPPGKDSSVGITRTATVLGTPAYLAPESLNGSKFVDGRADLYALGAVAFWLLTGRLVFVHDQPIHIVQMHLQEPPPRASQHSPFTIPPELDALLLECLAKKPDERPANAGILRHRLERIPFVERWNQEHAAAWWNGRKTG